MKRDISPDTPQYSPRLRLLQAYANDRIISIKQTFTTAVSSNVRDLILELTET